MPAAIAAHRGPVAQAPVGQFGVRREHIRAQPQPFAPRVGDDSALRQILAEVHRARIAHAEFGLAN